MNVPASDRQGAIVISGVKCVKSSIFEFHLTSFTEELIDALKTISGEIFQVEHC